MTTAVVARPRKLRGEIIAPGDKSVSHRSVMFNAMARGTATVTHFSPGADCTSSVGILEALGVEIHRQRGPEGYGDTLTVTGRGMSGFVEPGDVLDAGNSGTSTRLMAGILAARPFMAILNGDASIRKRPMGRVIVPLKQMGAVVRGRKDDTLAPIVFDGGKLKGISYTMPVASAQLKSSLLLAGLRADGRTTLTQPALSRDHTERMLRAMGADVREEGLKVTIGPSELNAVDVRVPGDISSAAFWMVAAACHPDAELMIRGVGVNPTRSGVLDALKAMNANLKMVDERDEAGEPVADMLVKSSSLRGAVIEGDIVPLLIDEIPVLAVAAAMAEGVTVFRDVAELRVKETDRIDATIDWLRKAGVECDGTEDTLTVVGRGRLDGGEHVTYDDHRLAMSLGVAGLLADSPLTIHEAEVAGISYPEFWQELEKLGGRVG